MSPPYSLALREQIIRAVIRGISRRTTAQLFDVSLAFVVKLMQRWERDHTLAPKRVSAFALTPHADIVRALVAKQPRITIDKLRERLAEEGIVVGRAALGRFLIASGLSYKNRRKMSLGGGDPIRIGHSKRV
jgi:transposase